MKVEHLLEDLLSNGIDLSNLDDFIIDPNAIEDKDRRNSIKLKRRKSNSELDSFSS